MESFYSRVTDTSVSESRSTDRPMSRSPSLALERPNSRSPTNCLNSKYPADRQAGKREHQLTTQHTRISAYGLVSQSDRLLLCRISRALPRWEGQWTLPGGGIIFGEHPAAAVVREVEEETGLIVAAKSVAAIDSIHDGSQGDDFHGIRIIYETALLGGTLRYEIDGTTDECRWCSRSDIESLTLVDLAATGVRIWLG